MGFVLGRESFLWQEDKVCNLMLPVSVYTFSVIAIISDMSHNFAAPGYISVIYTKEKWSINKKMPLSPWETNLQ